MRIALVSDVHANLHALDAVLTHLEDQDIDEVVCLGDVSGYNAHPRECLARIRKMCDLVLKGNHDEAVATGRMDRMNWIARMGVEHSRRCLDADDIEFLRQLPAARTLHVEGTYLECYHASPADPLEDYVTPEKAPWWFARLMHAKPRDEPTVVALGHTHVPMLLRSPPSHTSPLVLLNPGSVGQPRDADCRASYAVLDTVTFHVDFHRVAYDVEGAVAALADASLPAILAQRLRTGTIRPPGRPPDEVLRSEAMRSDAAPRAHEESRLSS